MLARQNDNALDYLANSAKPQPEFEGKYFILGTSLSSFSITQLGADIPQILRLFSGPGKPVETKAGFRLEPYGEGGFRAYLLGPGEPEHLFDLEGSNAEFFRPGPFRVSDFAIIFPSEEAYLKALECLPGLGKMLAKAGRQTRENAPSEIDDLQKKKEETALTSLEEIKNRFLDAQKHNISWALSFD